MDCHLWEKIVSDHAHFTENFSMKRQDNNYWRHTKSSSKYQKHTLPYGHTTFIPEIMIKG